MCVFRTLLSSKLARLASNILCEKDGRKDDRDPDGARICVGHCTKYNTYGVNTKNAALHYKHTTCYVLTIVWKWHVCLQVYRTWLLLDDLKVWITFREWGCGWGGRGGRHPRLALYPRHTFSMSFHVKGKVIWSWKLSGAQVTLERFLAWKKGDK